MFFNIIENYIPKLTKNDIVLFSNKNNINLCSNEVDYIYNVLKKDYKILLSNNYNVVFESASKIIDNQKLEKIYNLYLNYRKKYSCLFKKNL